jgi:glycosyltransferase involved in cell wall biosynthesis
MKLSIILPVYNVEPFIERCIRSLEAQDLPHAEYEVIVVNDGSPDNSREVVLGLQQQFSNIILIDQENKGVSLARNAGMDRAQGDYLLFIDPDDYVLPNTLSGLLAQAYTLHVDVSFLGYYFLNVEGQQVAAILHEQLKNKIYSGIDAYFLSRGNGKTDPDRSVAILYNREFMSKHQLRYVAQIPYLEDGEFIARVLCLAERCTFSGVEFYMRTTRPGSATNSDLFYQDKSVDGFIRAAKNLSAFRSRDTLSIKQRIFLNQPIIKFSMLSVQACVSRSYFKNIFQVRKKLKREKLDQLPLEGCRGVFASYGQFYNISVYLFFIAWVFRVSFIQTFRS